MIWNKIIKSNIYFETLAKTIKVLPRIHHKQGVGIFFLTILNSLVDVIGLALIIPVIYLINDPSPIHNNQYLNMIYEYSGIYKETMFVFVLILGLVVVFALKNLFAVYVYYRQNKFAYDTALNLINRQANHFLTDTYQHSKEKNSNYYVRDIATIPNEYASSILIPIMKISNELLVLIFMVIGLFSYDIKVLLLLLFTICPVVILIMFLTKKKADEMGKKKYELLPVSYKNIFEIVYSYIDVKLFGKEIFFVKRIRRSFKKLFNTSLWIYTLQRIPQRVMEFAIILAIMILYGVIILLMNRSEEDVVWVLILFATAAYRIMPSLNEIMSSVILLRSSQHVFDLLNEDEVEIEEDIQTSDFKFKQSLELKDLKYRYPNANKLALNGINLTIEKGSNIGIIGESGSGKTTLGKIILRLIKESDGQFLVDEKPLKNDRNWYKKVAYVQQDFHIQDSCLAENIAFGVRLKDIDKEKLELVIKQANLTDLVEALENGYQSNVGEFGSKLSGGQKQRIAIARALYKGAELLILDEATNALDASMENEIMNTIYSLSSYDLTIIIISHRMHALKKCDAIYKIKSGEIVGKYNFDEIQDKV